MNAVEKMPGAVLTRLKDDELPREVKRVVTERYWPPAEADDWPRMPKRVPIYWPGVAVLFGIFTFWAFVLWAIVHAFMGHKP